MYFFFPSDLYIESHDFGKSQKFKHQFYGLFMKRFHYAKRHWNILVVQIVIPFIILSFCQSNLTSLSHRSSVNEPALKLKIQEVYGKTDGFYQSEGDPLSKLVSTEMQKVLKENDVNAKTTDDPTDFILSYSKSNLADYYKRLMVGGTAKASDKTLNLTAWFNGYPHHAEPMSLLLMDNAILRHVTKSGSIVLTNAPLPHVDTFYFEDVNYMKERIFANMYVTLALTFVSGSFVLVPVHERITKAKLLQMMTGISPATYWFSMFAWDFIMNTIVSLVLILPFAIFSHYAFFAPHSEAIGELIEIFLLSFFF